MNNNSGHRAAITLPAAKQDAQPEFTGFVSMQVQAHCRRLLDRIAVEEHYVNRVLAMSAEEFESLSPAAKMVHGMSRCLVAGWKEDLAALEAAQADNQGGAI